MIPHSQWIDCARVFGLGEFLRLEGSMVSGAAEVGTSVWLCVSSVVRLGDFQVMGVLRGGGGVDGGGGDTEQGCWW